MKKGSKPSKKFNLASFIKSAGPVEYVIMGVIVLLFAVIIAVPIMLISGKAGGGADSTATGSSAVSDDDTSYNKDAQKIDAKVYSGTVLEESKDAGAQYIADTLFIGDSNTVRSMSYGMTTLSNNVSATSMGIQHVISKPIVFFKGKNNPVTVPEAVAIIQPQRIVITYGTNNTVGWSDETFISEYKKAADAIVKAYPYAEIIINSIPPIDKQRENMQVTMKTIDSFNSALAQFAKKEGYKFLNTAEVLKDEKTGYAKTDYTISDGIHLNKKANEAWFKYIRTHSYITEDRRPKPLKEVPGRKETPPDIISEDPLAVRGQKKAVGVKVVFSAGEGGSIQGALSQAVKKGEYCSGVTAVPNAGYMFAGWACSVGSIGDVMAADLTFTVPADFTDVDSGIAVAASFSKASISFVNGKGDAASSVSLTAGENYATGIVFPSGYQGGKTLVYTSDNSAVASVSGDGMVTAVAAGTANITAATSDGALSAKLSVTVAAKVIVLADFGLSAGSATLDIGGSTALSIASVSPEGAPLGSVVWASSNPTVASVDANGTVVAVGAGTANIICTVNNIQKVCAVTVNAPAPPPVVDPTPPPVVDPTPPPVVDPTPPPVVDPTPPPVVDPTPPPVVDPTPPPVVDPTPPPVADPGAPVA